jgi:hypothetical protein
MKLIALIVLTLLITTSSAETWKFGSYEVTTNLSTPANYTLDTPSYDKEIGIWSYTLNITPNTGGYGLVMMTEFVIPMQGRSMIDAVSKNMIEYYGDLGGVQYGTKTYKGHDAFEISNPAQKTDAENGGAWIWPESRTLVYQPDEGAGVTIQAVNAEESFFREMLDSTEVHRAV